MNSNEISQIVKLRIIVAYLGEKEQANWWSSSFLSRSGEAFLIPVFPKTSMLARINGACVAARTCHDDHIGIGDVYNLFRLPENIEHDISMFLINDGETLEHIVSEVSAKIALQELSKDRCIKGVGPLILEHKSMNDSVIIQMAAAYLQGFSSNEPVYPYYRGEM